MSASGTWKMDSDDELALRLKVEHLESREKFLVDVLSRLLRHASLPEGATSKTYSNKEMRYIRVSSRSLATALRALNI